MQYLHNNLKMHNLYVGAKCNTHIITLIHTIYGKEKHNICMTI